MVVKIIKCSTYDWLLVTAIYKRQKIDYHEKYPSVGEAKVGLSSISLEVLDHYDPVENLFATIPVKLKFFKPLTEKLYLCWIPTTVKTLYFDRNMSVFFELIIFFSFEIHDYWSNFDCYFNFCFTKFLYILIYAF